VIETTDGQLVNIEINNNAAYGYDVRAELVGERGSISMASANYTRLDMNLRSSTSYAADWRAAYREAYVKQNRAWLAFVNTGVFPEIGSSAWDGYCSTVVANAGVVALAEGRKVAVELGEKPALYR